MWTSKYDYIISVSVHWLIVNAHIDYELLFLTSEALLPPSTPYITDPLAALFTEYTFIVIFQRDSSEQSLFHWSFLTVSANQKQPHYCRLGGDSTTICFLEPKGYLSSHPTSYTSSAFSSFFLFVFSGTSPLVTHRDRHTPTNCINLSLEK